MSSPSALPGRAAVALLVLLLAVGATACTSGDGGDASESTSTSPGRTSTTRSGDDRTPDTLDDKGLEPTVANYVEALAGYFGEAGDVFSEEGVHCLAGRWVDAIGVDTFREAGVLPGDLTREGAQLQSLEIDRATAEGLAGAFEACGLQLRDAYLRTLEGDLTEQGKACVEDLLTEDAVRRSFVADLLGEELDPNPLTQVDRCAR